MTVSPLGSIRRRIRGVVWQTSRQGRHQARRCCRALVPGHSSQLLQVVPRQMVSAGREEAAAAAEAMEEAEEAEEVEEEEAEEAAAAEAMEEAEEVR